MSNRCSITELNQKSHIKILGETDTNKQDCNFPMVENTKDSIYVYSRIEKKEGNIRESFENWDDSPIKIEDTSVTDNRKASRISIETDLGTNEKSTNSVINNNSHHSYINLAYDKLNKENTTTYLKENSRKNPNIFKKTHIHNECSSRSKNKHGIGSTICSSSRENSVQTDLNSYDRTNAIKPPKKPLLDQSCRDNKENSVMVNTLKNLFKQTKSSIDGSNTNLNEESELNSSYRPIINVNFIGVNEKDTEAMKNCLKNFVSDDTTANNQAVINLSEQRNSIPKSSVMNESQEQINFVNKEKITSIYHDNIPSIRLNKKYCNNITENSCDDTKFTMDGSGSFNLTNRDSMNKQIIEFEKELEARSEEFRQFLAKNVSQSKRTVNNTIFGDKEKIFSVEEQPEEKRAERIRTKFNNGEMDSKIGGQIVPSPSVAQEYQKDEFNMNNTHYNNANPNDMKLDLKFSRSNSSNSMVAPISQNREKDYSTKAVAVSQNHEQNYSYINSQEFNLTNTPHHNDILNDNHKDQK